MKEKLKMLQVEDDIHQGYKKAAKRDGKFARQVAREALMLYEADQAKKAKKAAHVNYL